MIEDGNGVGMEGFLMAGKLAERITQLRTEAKLTQEELGNMLKVKRGTVASWESGHRTPELRYLEQMAQIFDVSVDYLLGRSDHRKTQLPDWLSRVSPEWQKRILEDEALTRLMFKFLDSAGLKNLPTDQLEMILTHQARMLQLVRARDRENETR
nr:MAG: hypothetical protein DIU61_19795 [Bacteroidota bacterium]